MEFNEETGKMEQTKDISSTYKEAFLSNKENKVPVVLIVGKYPDILLRQIH